MKKILVIIAAGFFVGNAWASGPECTTEDPANWMSEADFIDKAKLMGYATDTFAVTEGSCYSLTKLGSGDDTELEYFDPVSGEQIVQ